MQKCNICIEETCKGKHDCHCENCNKRNECYRVLRPTIRITNKCTQKCDHCCFSSHPQSELMMTPTTAEKIAQFLKANDIRYANVMGGEFFCNPNWYEIMTTIGKSVNYIRLVSNSDWAGIEGVESLLLKFVDEFRDKLTVSLSKDRWHTNRKVEEAEEFLKNARVNVKVATEEETTERSIVPIGRGELIGSMGFYSFAGCYCQNPETMYGFLIDEDGDIYKCGFGMIKYAEVGDYINGGFDKRFKDFNMRFHKAIILNCSGCIRAVEHIETQDKRRCQVKRL